MHLRGRELVAVAAVDLDEADVAGLDVAIAARIADQVRSDDLLAHRHRARRHRAPVRRELRRHDRARRELRRERKEPAGFDDRARHRVVAARELLERDLFAALQALELRVAAHELPEVDVVALVDRRERGRDHEVDPRPLLGLRRGLARAARALALARDDHLEAAVHQRARSKTRFCALSIRPAYASSAMSSGRWRKHTHAGVITSVLMSSSRSSGSTSDHATVDFAAQLAPDLFQVLEQEQDALFWRERDVRAIRQDAS